MNASIDSDILVCFNSNGNAWLDSFITTCTSTLTWTPLFLALIAMIRLSTRSWKHTLTIVVGGLLCVLAADIMVDGIVKPLVARPRPCNSPALTGTINIVNGYRADGYSFFSGHASNTCSLAVFLIYIVRRRWFATAMLGWSLLNCYTRLYLAQHYPSDIIVGLAWGALVGTTAYKLIKPRLPQTEYKTAPAMAGLAICLLYAAIRAT